MPSTSERRALVLVSVLASLGAVARVSRATHSRPEATPAEQGALDQQIARVESARAAQQTGGARHVRGGVPTPRATRSRITGGTGDLASTRPPTPDSRPIVVDLDVASETEIERLPRVGHVLAVRIVANRDSCGAFGSLDRLQRVNGIGDGVARRLAPFVTFSGASSLLGTVQGAACPGADNRAALRRRGRPQ